MMFYWIQRKIEEMQKRKRQNIYAEGKFFDIYTGEGIDPKLDIMSVKILNGKFKGVIYSYTSLNVDENTAKCSFDVRFIDTNKYHEKILLNNREFNKILGQVLLVALENALEFMKERNEIESREDYSEESIQRRTLYKENSTIFEE
jgi:hypothetical protein